MKPQDQKLETLLISEWAMLQQSLDTFELSLKKCKSIGIKNLYTFEEQESFDSLTSKFARTSDLFTQKILRTVRSLLHDPPAPYIDLANQSEKTGIINSSDELIDIRDLRNEISHEYIPEAIQALIPEIFKLSKALLDNIKTTEIFLKNRSWIM